MAGTSILDAARSAGINLAASCGGKGFCGQCRIIITGGVVSSPLQNEDEILSPEDRNCGHRLACSTFIESDIKVHVPEKSHVNDLVLQLEGERISHDVDPLIRSYDVAVNPPSLTDPISDIKRIIKFLGENHNISVSAVDIIGSKHLSELLRKGNWEKLLK